MKQSVPFDEWPLLRARHALLPCASARLTSAVGKGVHFDSSKTKVLHFAMNPAKKAANLKALNRAMCAVGPPAAARVPTVPARSQSAVGDAYG